MCQKTKQWISSYQSTPCSSSSISSNILVTLRALPFPPRKRRRYAHRNHQQLSTYNLSRPTVFNQANQKGRPKGLAHRSRTTTINLNKRPQQKELRGSPLNKKSPTTFSYLHKNKNKSAKAPKHKEKQRNLTPAVLHQASPPLTA